MIPAGERTTLVTFESGTPTEDDYGGETMAWGTLATVMAKVLYGTGAERRQAAQEQAQQAATIMVNFTPSLAGVVTVNRARFDDATWDITSPPARVGLNDELHFSAVRSA